MHYLHVSSSLSSEEAFRSSGTGIMDLSELIWVLGTEPGSSAKSVSALNR